MKATPYEDRTAEDLRDELRGRELPTSGSKADLVERLKASDATPAPIAKSATQSMEVPAPPTAMATTATARKRRHGECVVDDGTPHTGRAVNGVICSAHAMNYRADGTRRGR